MGEAIREKPERDPASELLIGSFQAVAGYNAMLDRILPLTADEANALRYSATLITTMPAQVIERAHADKVELLETHTDQLRKMGILLIPTYEPDPEPEPDSEPASDMSLPQPPPPFGLLITDGEAFSEMLGTLRPIEEQQEELLVIVEQLLSTGIQFVESAYTCHSAEEDPDSDEAVELLEYAEMPVDVFAACSEALILSGYGGLPSFQELARFNERYEDGTLADYIGAEIIGLHREDFGGVWSLLGGSGQPASELTEKWLVAMDYLAKLQAEESPYFSELFVRLRMRFDTVVTEIAQFEEGQRDIPDVFQDAMLRQIQEIKRLRVESGLWDLADELNETSKTPGEVMAMLGDNWQVRFREANIDYLIDHPPTTDGTA